MPAPETTRSRMPNPLAHIPEIADIGAALHKAIAASPIPQNTIGLMQLRAGQILGSTYFTVRDTTALRAAGEPEDRITAVATWRDSPHFTGPERAALGLVEAVLTPCPHAERVSDALLDQAREHYDDKELWSLITVIGYIGFFTPAALIAKPIPGMPPGQNYTDR